jgi:nigerose phosphorylase
MKNLYVCENEFKEENIPFYGNKFLTGNGYMGVRGTLSESRKDGLACINLAGVYDKVGDGWRESVNAPNALYSYITVNGEKLIMPEKQPVSHEMKLDIISGVLYRTTVFSCGGGNVTVSACRAVSMSNKNLILEKITVKTDFDANISVLCGIDGDVWDINGPHFTSIVSDCEGEWLSVKGTTVEKGITVTSRLKIECDGGAVCKNSKDSFSAYRELSYSVKAGEEKSVCKLAVISTSADENPTVMPGYFASELDLHIALWNNIAKESYIEIDGDDEAELALNYSLYHLNCIAPRHSKSLSIAARGLSGQVYKGAIFWDTEMFMFDYFLHNYPDIARTLLMYRIDSLTGAKAKASEYGYDGAFYAWESQEGGFEACSDYNIVDVFTKRPMRTYFRDKQVHVSAAMVYAFEKYVNVTGDTSIIEQGGGKVILECAKFYRSLILRHCGSEFYEIWDVVGPDEYHERVNNNGYTNRMAKFVFETVAKYADMFDEDVSEFAELANKIFVPQPDETGLIEQFDGYFKLEDCSISEVRSRLLDPKEYWGGAYGVAAHTQVLKQADVVALMSMFPQEYTVEQMKRNFEYYEPRTEHGSSLSACMYSLLSCYMGNPEFAYPLFMKSASADIKPGGKQWAGLVYIGGTHPASAGGAWMVAVRGFAGMQIRDGELTFKPNMPSSWNGMRFKLRYRGEMYSVNITRTSCSVDKI